MSQGLNDSAIRAGDDVEIVDVESLRGPHKVLGVSVENRVFVQDKQGGTHWLQPDQLKRIENERRSVDQT